MAERTLAHEKIEAVWDSAVEEILPEKMGGCGQSKPKTLRMEIPARLAAKECLLPLGTYPTPSPLRAFLIWIQMDIWSRVMEAW